MALARSWVEDAVEQALAVADALARTTKDAKAKDAKAKDGIKSKAGARRARAGLEVLIGTMIETPRAALRAGEIAEVAEFFSFGTNDLTQMVFGFSRDDVEGRMMSTYLDKGLLKRNPFETIDAEGVGELVREAVVRGRATRPDLKIGVCGEHGGDPESIAVFASAGLDYVSCSPFRVPIARLASAQAVLSGDGPARPGAGTPHGARTRSSSAKASERAKSPKRAGAAVQGSHRSKGAGEGRTPSHH
jgi:citrate lyase beta subunit